MSYWISVDQTLNTVTTHQRTKGGFCCGGRPPRPAFQWLAVTSINLLFNAPDFVLRLLNVFNIDASDTFLYSYAAVHTARLLYFVQFCINAGYLSTVIFRRPVSSLLDKKKALKWPKFRTLTAALNANYAASSNSTSAPLLCLESLEPRPAVKDSHSVVLTYTLL